MKKETTLKDIANMLNVSISTVSKSLNDSDEISPKTVKRIKEYAASVNYVPNDIARSLKTRKTRRIGVIVPNILDDFFGKVIHAIELEANKQDYKLVVCLSIENIKREEESILDLLKGTVDGLILSLSKQTQDLKKFSHLKEIEERQFPLVMFDRICKEVSCDKVTINDFEAGYNATSHLINTKCSNIAFLSTISQTSVSESRKKGYCKALKDNNFNNLQIINIPNYEDFESILSNNLDKNKIDGILAADQFSAVCAMNIIQKRGLNVPVDISVIGFTDSLLAKHTLPSLTTVSQNAEEMGKLAIKTLIDRIESEEDYGLNHQVIKTELIIRNSTR